LSGSSPLTCLAWKALAVAYATASTSLGIMWPHKPDHYVKVGIPSGGICRNYSALIVKNCDVVHFLVFSWILVNCSAVISRLASLLPGSC
jgi:hypothetical protein